MALRNARDLYTRRNEGVSIWVVPADAIAASDPDAKGAFFESPAGQGLPARHVLHQERGGEAPVTRLPSRNGNHAGHGDISVGVARASGDGSPAPPASRPATPSARRTSRSTSAPAAKPTEDVAEYALRLGDDALILAQRLGHWISRAPELEEDVALGNIALDQLGPRPLASSATPARPRTARSEDDLAYFRDEHEFRSRAPVRAAERRLRRHTIARQFVVSPLPVRAVRAGCATSTDATLAGDRRQGGQGGRLPPRPRRPVDAAPGPRHRRVARGA